MRGEAVRADVLPASGAGQYVGSSEALMFTDSVLCMIRNKDRSR